jgi:hypothetical protein
MPTTRRGGRRSLRFRPLVDLPGGGPARLDRRLLLSAVPTSPAALPLAAIIATTAHPSARHGGTAAAHGRVGVAQEIRKQYAQFYANFRDVESSYVQSLSVQSGGTVNVTTTLTAPYIAGSASMQVADAGVFGPQGPFPSTVKATAQVGSNSVGKFALIGSAPGNILAIDVSQSTPVSLNIGTNLTAPVTTSASSVAGSIFPGYITTSTQQMAINLVSYFNSLPIKLPRFYARPHQPQRAGALQQYVYEVVAGSATTSLKNSLLAITLPQTLDGDLQIYDAAVKAAINASETQMLSNVQQIFAGKFPVVVSSSTGSSGSTAGTGSTSTTSGTGSTSGA